MKIQIINGPNLNLLGVRQKNIYGYQSFDEYLKKLKEHYDNVSLMYFQSNIEGEIIDKIQEVGFSFDGIIINAGGYSHTSVAIADAILSIECPAIEVHVSNLLSRENFRHNSVIGHACKGSIMGFGLESYRLALDYFLNSK